MTLGKRPDDAPLPLTGHRKKSGQCVPAQIYVQSVMFKRPVYLNVGNVKQSLKRAAAKRDLEAVTNQTVSAVAANQIFCFDSFKFARGRFDIRCNGVAVL